MRSRTYKGEDRRRNDDEAYFNSQYSAKPIYLEPRSFVFGENQDEMFVATVGSGVAVSIYDIDLRIGALAYVLLSDELLKVFPYFKDVDPDVVREAFQPVVDAMAEMAQGGAARERMRVRLIGASIIEGYDDDRSTKNFVFTQEYLTRQGLQISQQDIGGFYIRRLHFFPKTGQTVTHLLRRDYDYLTLKALEAA